MAETTRFDELHALRIDRNQLSGDEPPRWAKRVILTGIAIVVLLGVVALAWRVFAPTVTEVEVARAVAETGSAPGITLSASGYIVAHHKIDVNSKVTGRVAWIGVEKGDHVQRGQVLVRLEDDEFRAQVEQARGAVDNATAYLKELETGSRPQEIQEAQSNLAEARATLANDQLTLNRTRSLVAQGIFSRQQLDDAQAKFDADQQRVNSLQQAYDLARVGPRPEEIARARGALSQAQGQLAYAESQLDATRIRAPVTGTILERTAEKGELITAQFASAADTGGPRGSVVSLADLNDLQVELDISQDDFAKLIPKQHATLTTDAFPDRKYNGVIAEISPEANRQKATVQVKVQVLNPDSYLRPEMNATVQFLSPERPNAQAQSGVLVPTAAVRDSSKGKIVLIAYNGHAIARNVRILSQRSQGDLVDGLTGGEEVIVNAPSSLKDGDRIKIKGQ